MTSVERLRDSRSCPTLIRIGEALRSDWPAVPATNPVEHATDRVAGPATLDQRRSTSESKGTNLNVSGTCIREIERATHQPVEQLE